MAEITVPATTPETESTSTQPTTTDNGAGGESAQNAGTSQAAPAGATFTQSDVERIVKDRLDRATAKAEAAAAKAAEEAERKAAEQQGEFKKLYETELAKREAAERQAQSVQVAMWRKEAATSRQPAGWI